MSNPQCAAGNAPADRRLAPEQCQTTLERDFPRVLMAIQAMWGFPELNSYFYKLTMDERGKRHGFPEEVWDDIHLLWNLHQSFVPDPGPQFSRGLSCV